MSEQLAHVPAEPNAANRAINPQTDEGASKKFLKTLPHNMKTPFDIVILRNRDDLQSF